MDEPDAEQVLAEINGRDANGKPLTSYKQLNADGSTRADAGSTAGSAPTA